MLNLKNLLLKLITSIGGEPLLNFSSATSSFSPSSRIGGRISVGMSSDGDTCWTITALGSSGTAQYYLVELYSKFVVKYNEVSTVGTSGGFSYAYLNFGDLEDEGTAQHPSFYNMATASLSDLINVGGSRTLLCRTAFGSYISVANTGNESNMHSDLCCKDDFTHFRFQAHRTIAADVSNLTTFCYVVSLWKVDSPTFYI